jgi:hypothetical protein
MSDKKNLALLCITYRKLGKMLGIQQQAALYRPERPWMETRVHNIYVLEVKVTDVSSNL